MENLRRILVGLELNPRAKTVSTGSMTAFRQGMWLAKQWDGSLTLLHSTWTDDYREPMSGAISLVHKGMPEEGLQALKALEAKANAAGVPTTLEILPERPWLAVTHAALRKEVDLVVVGKRNEQAAEGRRLGSVSVKLLRKCPAPVWAVKPDHDLELKLILAATDLTPVGDCCLEYAAYLANRRKSELHIVHAYQVPMELQLERANLSEEEYAERLKGIRSRVRGAIDRTLETAGFGGEPNVHVSRGIPSAAIREAVEHLQPDLLVMGTVSRGGIAGFLVGNTAEKLMERVDCSLLAVKPEDFVCPVQVPK
ncbi:MAG: universal stress protein [bacterium]|nr:universal stress protein [bacterium]